MRGAMPSRRPCPGPPAWTAVAEPPWLGVERPHDGLLIHIKPLDPRMIRGRLAAPADKRDLREHGIEPSGSVYWNLTSPALYTHALRREEGVIAHGGPFVVDTGKHTGRSAEDKFVVREPGSEDRIWWGKVNQPMSEEQFDRLRAKVAAHLGERDLYVSDHFAGADPDRRGSPCASSRRRRTTRCSRVDVHPSRRPRARVLHARRPHPPRARPRGRSRGGRHPHRHVHRAAPDPPRGADRRHVRTPARSRSRSSRC